MKTHLKRILSSPVFITCFAFAVRMLRMYIESRSALSPVRSNLPFGYELGSVARAIAEGRGFFVALARRDYRPNGMVPPLSILTLYWNIQDLGNLQ